MKATGHGLRVAPASVNVAAGVGTHVDGKPVQFVDLRVDDGVAALAWIR